MAPDDADEGKTDRPPSRAVSVLRPWPAEGYVVKFQVTVDRDEDGVWVTECPAIPGCVSQGDTKKEAMKNIRKAIRLCLEVRAERGMPLTVETY
jgi:predicted RNase H-like HicB family nuclease